MQPWFEHEAGRGWIEEKSAAHVRGFAAGTEPLVHGCQSWLLGLQTGSHTRGVYDLYAEFRISLNGVDITVIALWLGHESPTTTHHYVEQDINLKQQALRKLAAPKVRSTRFEPTDQLLKFLEAL